MLKWLDVGKNLSNPVGTATKNMPTGVTTNHGDGGLMDMGKRFKEVGLIENKIVQNCHRFMMISDELCLGNAERERER